MDVLAGAAASVSFDLQGPLGTLPPDNSSVFSTVFDTTGAILSGPTAITTTTSMSVIPVTVASGNTITSPRLWEKRTVLLTWTSGGQSYSLRTSYRIVPFLNFTATFDDVRNALGVSEDEVGDADIDLFSAYFSVQTDATPTLLTAALASGGPLELAANQAIVAQAAFQCIPSLRVRILQSAADGVQKVTRYATLPDLDALAQDLRAARGAAIALVMGIAPPLPIYLTLTQPRDVITDGYRWRDLHPFLITNP